MISRVHRNVLKGLQPKSCPFLLPWMEISTTRHICSRGLSSTRHANSVTTAGEQNELPHMPSNLNHFGSDKIIRSIFDENQYTFTRVNPNQKVGLFLYPQLDVSDPVSAFKRIVSDTIIRARAIYSRICSVREPGPHQERELRRVVKNLDRLSDTLCGVIDLAEFIRMSHPDSDMLHAANEAYEQLYSFMNILNTEVILYDILKQALETLSRTGELSQEEKQVAISLLRDFEKSGIHLPAAERSQFVSISDTIMNLGQSFLHGMIPAESHITVHVDKLRGLNPTYIRSLREKSYGGLFSSKGEVKIPLRSGNAEHMLLKYAEDADTRKKVYMASHSYLSSHIETLENMLKARADLARLVGMSSYGHLVLQDKMVQTPEMVMAFLRMLASHHRPKALEDVQRLVVEKQKHLNYDKQPTINAWDREFYADKWSRSMSFPNLNSYFSIGTCLQGVSRLTTRLYGISLIPVTPSPGEVWHPDVRKLEIVDEDENGKVVGIIYCDLFQRPGKNPNAAHFTVRCSRRVDDDDIIGDGLGSVKLPGELTIPTVSMGSESKEYQLPVVVLMCDFATPDDTSPSCLSFHEVETLWHEMGHAIHSMIGRTEYHNVSGTRCATDFVELPSILMEHFISSKPVLELFARDYLNDQPLPYEKFMAHKKVLLGLSALEQHSQIMMGLLDQVYHSALPSEGYFNTERLMSDLYNAKDGSVIPMAPGVLWQGKFGHLFNYGGMYYSYIFDSAIANKVWNKVFDAGEKSLDRQRGDKYKKEVLKYGGIRNPWEAIGSLLGGKEGEVIAKGDAKAVEEVATWGIM